MRQGNDYEHIPLQRATDVGPLERLTTAMWQMAWGLGSAYHSNGQMAYGLGTAYWPNGRIAWALGTAYWDNGPLAYGLGTAYHANGQLMAPTISIELPLSEGIRLVCGSDGAALYVYGNKVV